MKVNIQKLARVTLPILTVVAFALCFVFPVSAAEIYNYGDYISKVEPDSTNPDNVLVYVDLPTNPKICIVDTSAQVRYYSTDSYLTIDMIAGHTYAVWFSSFGDIHPYNYSVTPWSGDLLNVSSIPAGSRLVQGVHVSYNGNTTIDGFSGRIFMGNSTTSLSSTEYAYESNTDGMLGWVYTLVGGYKYMATQQYSNPFVADFTGKFTFEIVTSQLVMSLNELVFNFQQNGSNKELLQAIEDKLAENGDTLKDIVSGTPSQNESAGNIKDNIDGSIQDIEDAGDAMDSFTPPTIDVEQILPDDVLEGQEFLAYIGAIKKFWESPVLTSMFTILGGLMFAGFAVFGKRG